MMMKLLQQTNQSTAFKHQWFNITHTRFSLKALRLMIISYTV
jgi:hypothetical protein